MTKKIPPISNPDSAGRRTTVVKTSTSTTSVRRSAAALGVAALMLALVSGCGGATKSSPATSDPATTVTTKLLSFMPATLTVKVGTTVTWHDSDEITHTVTTGTFTLGSDGLRTTENPTGQIDMPLTAGKDVSFTFDKPGKYVYYCSIHKGMNGEIDVTP